MNHEAVHRLVDYDLVFAGVMVVVIATIVLGGWAYRRVRSDPELLQEAVEEMIFFIILIGYTFPIARSLSYYRLFGSFPAAGLFAAGIGLALTSFLAPKVQAAYREKGIPEWKTAADI